jgi:hypothetical protein
MAPSKILDKIVKLFQLGSETDARSGSIRSEEEMMSAITKAKSLMMQHKISAYDVQMALDTAEDKTKPRHIKVDSYTAYTRKMKKFARYDELVAWCVAELTMTEPILRWRTTLDGTYISMTFVGEEQDIALAGELFMLFLTDVRKLTRKKYGSDKWTVKHTSYACGYAARMIDRAKAMSPATAQESQTMALVLRDTKSAIAKWKEEDGTVDLPPRKTTVDALAYTRGYIDGADFNLNKKIIR